MKTLYRAIATTTGSRNGHEKSDNGVLDLAIKIPQAMEGPSDEYTNTEQLFAADYSACFDSALNLIIEQSKALTGEISVMAKEGIG